MGKSTASLSLKQGREKPIQNRHPWVFSGAVAALSGRDPKPGDLVDIVSAEGQWLASAYYNPNSQIAARILSWEPDLEIDETFWRNRLQQAFQLRQKLYLEPATTAYRLVNAEADGIPGLVVDRYGEFLVFQALTAGIDQRKQLLVSLLVDMLEPVGILERSDVSIRKKEGLAKITGIRHGVSPAPEIIVSENDISFMVDLYGGHKTGMYLDQRENRTIVCDRRFVEDSEILNVFAYTGGFSAYAARNKARTIVNIDSSTVALDFAQRNMAQNQWDRPTDEYLNGDAFQELRNLNEMGRRFDMVILDPPKFAFSKKDIPAASRGYKDINMLAMQLLRPNGWLATFSCSGLVNIDLFQKILFGAAVDAGRQVQIIRLLGQAPDHPVLVTFPESAYLKGFFCRIL